jgi:hypothetical protein
MRRSLALIAVLGLGLLSAPVAFGSAAQVIADCNSHGTLTGHYSTTDLRAALGTIPAPVKEYTDCYDVINRQITAQIEGTPSGGGTVPAQSSTSSAFPTWLIVVLGILALAGAALGTVALRRRGTAGPGES